eukprot:1179034-Prorocentrum_minimum.AAC.3
MVRPCLTEALTRPCTLRRAPFSGVESGAAPDVPLRDWEVRRADGGQGRWRPGMLRLCHALGLMEARYDTLVSRSRADGGQ